MVDRWLVAYAVSLVKPCNGSAMARTGYPSRRSRSMTGFQLEESAHAPWTRTMVGFGAPDGPTVAEAVTGAVEASRARAVTPATAKREKRKRMGKPLSGEEGMPGPAPPDRGGAGAPGGSAAVGREQAQPHFTDGGKGRDRVPEPVQRDLAGHGDRGCVQQLRVVRSVLGVAFVLLA